ncbi:hypothetical protein Bca52824_078040 [Brassica carinata]|uniref:Uncharacterized protein n=1 Tax=Brassica carinata TaxID=52824 RepID=A0A8X7PV31_BRACI|nr:hypothetical protein Bca52824_078040 [Brassica carinata]
MDSISRVRGDGPARLCFHYRVHTEGYQHRTTKTGDPLIDGNLASTVNADLILLENQLPYFILEKLFDPIVPRMCQYQTFRELIIAHFGSGGKIDKKSKFRHITDLLRCALVETLPQHDEVKCEAIDHMYNADKLDYGGIKFETVGEEFSLYVSFKNGCLKMSCITVDDELEMRLRNIMALEQCHYPFNSTYVTMSFF